MANFLHKLTRKTRRPAVPLRPAVSLPPAIPLPLELMEMIASYVDDVDALRSCTFTCRLGYLAAVRHLPFSITTLNTMSSEQWSTLLKGLDEFGLLPFLKRLSILAAYGSDGFTPQHLDGPNLDCFPTLKHLQELRIDRLQISSFIPNIKRYFGHLEETLETLALGQPGASVREILYLIGHFPKLQNLKLCDFDSTMRYETEASWALVPPNKPPLRGWLTLDRFKGRWFADDLKILYGGFHFRCVRLDNVDCTREVLDVCVETLETLYGRDEVYSGLDLSKFKSLQALEIPASSFTDMSAFLLLKDVLPTVRIASPRLLDVVIVYDSLVHWEAKLNHLDKFSDEYNFRPVHCIELSGQYARDTARELERELELQKIRDPDSPPSRSLITFRRPPI